MSARACQTRSLRDIVSVHLADGHEVRVFVWFDGRYNDYVTDPMVLIAD